MSFWQYCDKLTGFVGFYGVLNNIMAVYEFYREYKTVGECQTMLTDKIAKKGA
jgi:hypothetical protein